MKWESPVNATPFRHLFRLLFSLLMLVQLAWPQAATQRPTALQERISGEIKLIEDTPRRSITNTQLGRLWARLASDYQDEVEVQLSEEAYSHALTLLQKDISAQSDYATALDNFGSLYLLTGRIKESENCRKRALAVREAIGDKPGVARIRAQLAIVLVNQHKFKDAEQQALTALQTMKEQDDPNLTDIAATLLPLSYARCMQDRCKEGLADANQAMTILRTTLPSDSLPAGVAWLVGSAWLTLGYSQWKTGATADAEISMQDSLHIFQNQPGVPDSVLLGALAQYSDFLKAMHRKTEAHKLSDEMSRLANEQTQRCGNCTVDVHALSNAMR